MKKLLTHLKQNAVLRFWLTYVLMVVLAVGVCTVGLNMALGAVRRGELEKNQRLMNQGVQATETMIENMARIAMQMEDSDAVQALSKKFPSRATERFTLYTELINEYGRIGNYYDGSLQSNAFIYLNKQDRVIYNITVYPKEVFRSYTNRWLMSNGDWLRVCTRSASSAFVQAESGQLLYILPLASHSPGTKETLASLVFVLDKNLLAAQMPFLQNFSTYNYFIYEDGAQLFAAHELTETAGIDEEWYKTPGIYEHGEYVIISCRGEGRRIYITVLPLSEVIPELRSLRLVVTLLFAAVALAGAVIAYIFAFRTGKPVNEIARTLQEVLPPAQRNAAAPLPENGYSTDLKSLTASVARVVDERKQSQPALRKSFFHSLLKGSFVSNSEMLHTAQQAGLELTGPLYCAASLRLFYGMDLESINRDTVALAGALHKEVGAKLAELYGGAFWFYQHNILTGLYIIETEDDESWAKLIEALAGCVQWLESEHNVKARWGVGMPCNDLMQFWKSAEEANSMLEIEGLDTEVNLYLDYPTPTDGYYFPYSVEDRLAQGLRTSNTNEVESALNLIWEENFQNRTLSHKSFERLNSRIVTILQEQAQQLGRKEEFRDKIAALDSACREGPRVWYAQLESLCLAFCRQLIHDKSRQHSEKIQAVLEFIQQNYSNPDMGLSMVGSHFKLSDAYLSTLFKAEIKVNFGDYLENLRIEAACKMLEEGRLVTDIATAVGYNSVQSFRRAFKRVKGVSPSAYRQ